MAKTVPVREFRTHLSRLLSDVADRRDHVLVTRNGKPPASVVKDDPAARGAYFKRWSDDLGRLELLPGEQGFS
jgi:prevent-host-death family protein